MKKLTILFNSESGLNMRFEELKVGMKAEVSKTITETDVVLYAGITLDVNPAHLNKISTILVQLFPNFHYKYSYFLEKYHKIFFGKISIY